MGSVLRNIFCRPSNGIYSNILVESLDLEKFEKMDICQYVSEFWVKFQGPDKVDVTVYHPILNHVSLADLTYEGSDILYFDSVSRRVANTMNGKRNGIANENGTVQETITLPAKILPVDLISYLHKYDQLFPGIKISVRLYDVPNSLLRKHMLFWQYSD